MNIQASIDQPTHLELCDPLSLHISGWLYAGDRHPHLRSIEISHGGRPIGQTRLFFLRADVNVRLKCAPETRTGFEILAHDEGAVENDSVLLEFRATFDGGTASIFATRTVRFVKSDYLQRPYGNLLAQSFHHMVHRPNIYNSGPSVAGGNLECLALIQRYLGAPPCRVLDVGCGFGWYGANLLRAGYDWLGVEVKESDCTEMARQNLPHRHVDGRTLPFDDGAFDAALAIEVLEHIEEPHAFLASIRRVAPRLIISVPNIELIAYLHPYLAVPWHLLEADHKNFFNRWNLHELLSAHFAHVEVFGYGQAPLRTVEGTRLDFHLLAVASA